MFYWWLLSAPNVSDASCAASSAVVQLVLQMRMPSSSSSRQAVEPLAGLHASADNFLRKLSDELCAAKAAHKAAKQVLQLAGKVAIASAPGQLDDQELQVRLSGM